MFQPASLPYRLSDGRVELRHYRGEDAADLFAALDDPRAWEHIPRAIARDPAELDADLRAGAERDGRVTFVVLDGGRIVGTTAVFANGPEASVPEIGATQLDPAVWGTGVNTRAKRLLLDAVFAAGAAAVAFRTDERNLRSAAAIAKLGATELGVREDVFVRRDGSRRRSRFFRLDRPAVEVATITVKTDRHLEVARFWRDFLGMRVAPNHSDSVLLRGPGLPDLLIQPSAHPVATGAIHLDLRPADQDAAVARALTLGATRADIGQAGDEGWVVLADPGGNLFCLLESASDHAAREASSAGTATSID